MITIIAHRRQTDRQADIQTSVAYCRNCHQCILRRYYLGPRCFWYLNGVQTYFLLHLRNYVQFSGEFLSVSKVIQASQSPKSFSHQFSTIQRLKRTYEILSVSNLADEADIRISLNL